MYKTHAFISVSLSLSLYIYIYIYVFLPLAGYVAAHAKLGLSSRHHACRRSVEDKGVPERPSRGVPREYQAGRESAVRCPRF